MEHYFLHYKSFGNAVCLNKSIINHIQNDYNKNAQKDIVQVLCIQ